MRSSYAARAVDSGSFSEGVLMWGCEEFADEVEVEVEVGVGVDMDVAARM